MSSDCASNASYCIHCFDGREVGECWLQELKTLLPMDCTHVICDYNRVGESQWRASLRVNVKTKEDVEKWLTSFQTATKTTLRITRTRNALGKRILFRVEINMAHNHPIVAADVLRHRDVGPEAERKITELLHRGHSPSSALEILQYDLLMEHESNYIQFSADRYHCPDLQWCYRLYYKIFKEEYGENNNSQENLLSFVDKYNRDMASSIDIDNTDRDAISGESIEKYVAMEMCNQHPVVAVCTPIMKRAHRALRSAGELVFIDSSGNMDRENTRVFLLMTHSVAGGIPLGVFMADNEQSDTIAVGLKLLNSLLDQTAFNGRGSAGPAVFMTDDSSAERNDLKTVYPNARLLLCTFHILQAFWRYLWNAKTGVKLHHRQEAFTFLKRMVYSFTEEELIGHFNCAINNTMIQSYPKVLEHIHDLVVRRDDRAICQRSDILTRGNNTNNYCESAFRSLKDSILHRTKAFNIVQLLDFVLSRYEAYYETKLTDLANNKIERFKYAKYQPKQSSISDEDVVKESDDIYNVKSETTDDYYTVNMLLDTCSCEVGKTGAPCKHQWAVARKFKLASSNFLPISDATTRRLFYFIATGDAGEELKAWFKGLKDAGLGQVTRESSEASATDCPHTAVSAEVSEFLQAANTLVAVECETIGDEDIEALDSMIKQSADIVTDLFKSQPAEMKHAFRAYLDQLKKMTPANAVSAFHNFGKFSGYRRLGTSKYIGVQPTANARRKMALGGRRALGSGRPLKRLESLRCTKGLCQSVLPRKKAPHRLSKAVANLQSLGRTHQAK